MTSDDPASTWLPGSSPMARLVRQHDWSATPLGPIANWPQSLRTVVDLMLASVQPVYIGWGAEPISLCNDGYIPILGDKHPAVWGSPLRRLGRESGKSSARSPRLSWRASRSTLWISRCRSPPGPIGR